MAYTTEQLEYLKGAVESTTCGSFSHITAEFNRRFNTMVTRNAILGLAHRKKWAGRGRARPANVKRVKAPTETQALKRNMSLGALRQAAKNPPRRSARAFGIESSCLRRKFHPAEAAPTRSARSGARRRQDPRIPTIEQWKLWRSRRPTPR